MKALWSVDPHMALGLPLFERINYLRRLLSMEVFGRKTNT